MDKEIVRKIYNALNKEELNYFIDNSRGGYIIDRLDDMRTIEGRAEHVSSKLDAKFFNFYDLPEYIRENEAVDLLEVLEKHFLKWE